MAGFVDTTVADIDNRLGELEGRGVKVGGGPVRTDGGLSGGGVSDGQSWSYPQYRRRAPRTARNPFGGSPRPPWWHTRATQALELVRQRPGSRSRRSPERSKIEPNYLYRVMPKLVKDGPGQARRPGLAPGRPTLGGDRCQSATVRRYRAPALGRRCSHHARAGSDQSELLDRRSRSSPSSATVASIRARENSLISRPSTIVYSPPSQVHGKPENSPRRPRRSRRTGSPSTPSRRPGCRAPSRARDRSRRWPPTRRWTRRAPR